MTIKNLINAWSLPDRTQERQQITLRLNYDLYAKLHALKEVYPKRTVNDMINDILKTSLDEIIAELPVYKTRIEPEEAAYLAEINGGRMSDYEDSFSSSGPGILFDSAYRKILDLKSEETSSEEAA